MRRIVRGQLGGVVTACLLTAVVRAGDATRFRAVVIAPEGARDEFKTALKEAKWKSDGCDAAPKDWVRLGEKLDGYDVVLAAPAGLTGAVPADVSKALLGFMEAGGAVVATGVASSNDVAWLTELNAKYAVDVVTLDEKTRPPSPRLDADGNTTLLSYPGWANVPAEAFTRYFAFSGENKREWEVAGAANNQACVIVKRFGKGVLALSTARFQDAVFLGNVGKLLELQRLGLAFVGLGHEYLEGGEKVDKIRLGEGSTRAMLRNTSGTNVSVKVVMNVTGKDVRRMFWGVGGQSFPNDRFDVGVPVSMDVHGAADVTVSVQNTLSGGSAVLSAFSIGLPGFLVVEPPAYRGMISTARRDPDVHVAVSLNPVFEDVAGSKIDVSVSDPSGKELSTREVVAEGPGRIKLTLPLAADAPVGVYTLSAKMLRGGVLPETASATFKIVPVRPGQMFIDQDRVILKEGKPFFPIGLYHAQTFQDPDVFLALGVNMLQCWGWDWDDNLATNINVLAVEDPEKRAAQIKANAERLAKYKAAGVRLIYEEGSIWGEMVSSRKRPEEKYSFETNAVLHAKLEKVRDDPSKLVGMWYIADEVSGRGWVPNLLRAKNLFNTLDEDTPTYNLSSGDPAVAPGGDILAVDSYPCYVGEGHNPLTLVATAMDRARQGSDFRQPVIAVPQCFGEDNNHKEKPEEMRAMSYLAITHGVQGVFWYCWKETGDWNGSRKQGAGWNPPTAEMLKAVIAEFKVFTPALLEPGSRMLKSTDGRVHAILSGSEKTGRFLVYVNGEYEPVEAELELPELKGAKLEPLFGGPAAKVRNGQVALKLPKLATGAFRVTDK